MPLHVQFTAKPLTCVRIGWGGGGGGGEGRSRVCHIIDSSIDVLFFSGSLERNKWKKPLKETAIASRWSMLA